MKKILILSICFFNFACGKTPNSSNDVDDTKRKPNVSTAIEEPNPPEPLVSEKKTVLLKEKEDDFPKEIYDVVVKHSATSIVEKNTLLADIKVVLEKKPDPTRRQRHKAIDVAVEKIGTFPELAVELKKQIDEKFPLKRSLASFIRAKAKQLLKTASLDDGRKFLLEEMVNEPAQIAGDIDRKDIVVDAIMYMRDARANLPAREQFKFFEKIIFNHIKDKATKYAIKQNQIGPFSSAEIIYAISQSLLAEAEKQLHSDEAWIASGDYVPHAANSSTATEIFFDSHGILFMTRDEIIVRSSSQKLYENIHDGSEKNVSTNVDVVFDLIGGKIVYRNSYTVDGKVKTWTKTSF